MTKTNVAKVWIYIAICMGSDNIWHLGVSETFFTFYSVAKVSVLFYLSADICTWTPPQKVFCTVKYFSTLAVREMSQCEKMSRVTSLVRYSRSKTLNISQFQRSYSNGFYRKLPTQNKAKYLAIIGGGLVAFSYAKYVQKLDVVHAFTPKKLKVRRERSIVCEWDVCKMYGRLPNEALFMFWIFLGRCLQTSAPILVP